MKYKENINKNIFRGYAIRGIYPNEIDEDTAYTIGLGFGRYIREAGNTTCVVGHDNRLSSPAPVSYTHLDVYKRQRWCQ